VSELTAKNVGFADFLKQVQSLPQSHGLVLQAFLVTPVQRIPRYKLLLEDMLKNTEKDHEDYEDLKNSLKLVSEVALFVNETIRDHEMMLQMLSIQRSLVGMKQDILIPGRKFMKRGRVQKICRRNHQPRELFLFSDMLIYATPSIIDDHYHFHRLIPFEFCRLEDFKSTEQFIFRILSREKSFAVYTGI
jgi:hypothetical protein